MKNIVLRPLRAEDAERMLAFARAAGQETKNLTFGPEGLPLGTEAERAYLAAHGQGADSCELGAFDGETLAATGSVSRVACRRAWPTASVWPLVCAKATGGGASLPQ